MRSINDSKSAEKEGDFDQNIGVVQIERESERFRREAFERFILELASRVDDSRKVSHMIALPFLLTGGAEFVALNYSRAILENNPDSLVLLVVTDKGKISNKIQIPEHVILINLEDYICVNDYASKQDLLYDIINSIRPDVVHNINSEVAWFLILNQGEILTKFTNLYACIFAFQYDSDRKKIGYAANFLEKGLPFLSGLMTDNHRFIEDAIRTYPLIKEQATKLRVIYNPSRAAQGSTLKQVNERISSYSDRVKAGKNLNAIWAGRIDQEKRIDLFRDLVRISDFVNYDVYGNVVVDEIEKEFPNLDNLIYYGGFEDVNPIFSSKIYDVFIFTSKWEGMPNILIEAGSWGIPIIAPSVGGVSELINKDTGYLLPQNPTPYDYLRSLKAIKDNPTEAATKATNLLNLISRRHNWSAFFESVKDIPGYLCR